MYSMKQFVTHFWGKAMYISWAKSLVYYAALCGITVYIHSTKLAIFYVPVVKSRHTEAY